MQCFLPYSDFEKSAKCLDMKRLGKQRVEVLQLLKSIKSIKDKTDYRGWRNHPAREMFFIEGKHDYTNCLVKYGETICLEWRQRGYKDTCLEKIRAYYDSKLPDDNPFWLGNEDFHRAHRSMLIQKKRDHYEKMFEGTPDNLQYIWPTRQ